MRSWSTPAAAIAAVLLVLTLAAQAPAQYRWVAGGDPVYTHLYYGPTQVGSWSHREAKYYAYNGHIWGPACPCPVQPPVSNFGLDRSKLSGRERYALGGQEVTPAEAKRLLGAPSKLPDDAHKPFAVVVGSESDWAQARRFLDAKPFSDVLRVQCYRPEDAMVRDRDGRVMYAQGITLVSAEGVVVGHSDRFDAAGELAEGLRRLGPDYDPSRAPPLGGSRVGELLGLLPVLALGGLGVVLLVGLGAYVLMRRKDT